MERFEIGDKVIVKNYEDIPKDRKVKNNDEHDPSLWTRQKARACGKKMTVMYVIPDPASDREIYMLRYEDTDKLSVSQYIAEDLILDIPPEIHYGINVKVNPDIVVVTMTKSVDGEETQVGRTFADIYMDDASGVAKAAYYAMKSLSFMVNKMVQEGGI